jgi:hypothetical protein
MRARPIVNEAEHGHPEILDRLVQARRKDVVAIMDQISKIAAAQCLPWLLQRLLGARVLRHIEMQDSPRPVRYHHKDIEQLSVTSVVNQAAFPPDRS